MGFPQNYGINFYPCPQEHSNHSWVNQVLHQEERKSKSCGISHTSKKHFGNLLPSAIAIKIFAGRIIRNEWISNVHCTKPIYWYFIHIDDNHKFPHEPTKYVHKWQNWDESSLCFSEHWNFLLFVFYQFISICCDVDAVYPTQAMIIFLSCDCDNRVF